MLTFLYLAAKAGFQIDSYEDQAGGVRTKYEQGVLWVSAVTLHPIENCLERWQTPPAMARVSGETRADFQLLLA